MNFLFAILMNYSFRKAMRSDGLWFIFWIETVRFCGHVLRDSAESWDRKD